MTKKSTTLSAEIVQGVLELTCTKYTYYFARGQGNIAKIGIKKDGFKRFNYWLNNEQ